MKKFDVSLLIQVSKTLTVEAEDEDDATNFAYEICENDTIPVEPEDLPEILIEEVFEHEDEMLEH
jgi:hypothetical protein